MQKGGTFMNGSIKTMILFVGTVLLGIVCMGCINANNSNKHKTTVQISNDIYLQWKNKYVIFVNDNMSRVVNPQNDNATVSEGMGYGLLFSVAADDFKNYEKLWNYTRSYLDENGLMNWKIDSNGKVTGLGSATDADQDIAYSLLLAAKKWNNKGYYNEAIIMINAIKMKEIASDYVILPGDSWGNKSIPLNLSYISPLYYSKFGDVSGNKDFWKEVLTTNIGLLRNNVNQKTGLFPDWINTEGYPQFKKDQFGYDAIRVPIRLLQYYKSSNNIQIKEILQKEYDFILQKDYKKLVAGYDIYGNQLVNYLNTEYLASFSAMSLVDPDSNYSKTVISKLAEANDDSYYGCSLKTWIFFIMAGRL